MPFGPLQVQYPSGGLLQQIISQQSPQGSTLLYNNDANNTVYLCSKPNTNVLGLEESSPLAPLSSLIVDGTQDVYAYTSVNGQTATVMRFPSASAFQPGTLQVQGNVNATVAGNVNVTNTPNVNIGATGQVKINGQIGALDVSAATVNINPAAGYILPGLTSNLYSNTNATVIPAASGTIFPLSLDVSKYKTIDIKVIAYADSQATAGAAITANLNLSWEDDAGRVNQVFTEDISIYLGNGNTNFKTLTGVSPVHGHYLTLTITNPGTAGTITVANVTITGSYRSAPYATWRQQPPVLVINGVTVSQLTTSAANQLISTGVFTGNLGMLPNVTPGTGLRAYLLPLYAGPVSYYWSVNTAGLSNVGTLVDLSFVTSGNLVAGTSQAGMIRALSNTIGTAESNTINLPRNPVGLVVNPAATSQIQFSAIGQQGY